MRLVPVTIYMASNQNVCSNEIDNLSTTVIQVLYYSVCQQQRTYDRQTLINIYIKQKQLKTKINTKNQYKQSAFRESVLK
jgi:hypothetical protein